MTADTLLSTDTVMPREAWHDLDRSPRPAVPARLLTAAELATFLQLDTERLYAMRANGTGPAFVKIGRDVRYAWHDVREWLRERTYRSTSAAA